jgi:hypothetical protein
MKTQLLEDIGLSAERSLSPAASAGHPQAANASPGRAVAGKVALADRRAAVGVWRQKPVGAPAAPAIEEAKEPAPPQLHEAVEEIPAPEPQSVPPATGAVLTAPPLPDPLFDFTLPVPPSPPQSQREPALRMAEEDTPAVNPASSATLPHDPVFDFTPPATPPQAAAPFVPAPSSPAQSPRRYFLWGACLLSGALLIQGGRWLYQERSEAGSLALVASQAKEVAPVDRAIAVKEATPDAAARVQPIAAASTPLPAVPPLVMLKPEEYAAPKAEQAPAPVKSQAAPPTQSKPRPAAKPRSAPPVSKPSPKPSTRKAQAPAVATVVPAKERRKREPARPPGRASAVAAKKPAQPATATAATLKACRERGYGQAQCIKRGCSITRHGFSCRGR